jgi:tetratricopeptide (TPR) repeat protein
LSHLLPDQLRQIVAPDVRHCCGKSSHPMSPPRRGANSPEFERRRRPDYDGLMSMRRLAVLVSLLAAPAQANDLRDEARAHAELGKIAFRAERYADALAEFKKAYSLAPIPDLMFNIGRCQDELHQDAEALRSYKQFLAARPDTPDRAEIEARIHVLESRAAAAPRPPAPPPAPAVTSLPPPPPPPVENGAARRRRLAIGLGIGGAFLVAGALAVGLVVVLSGSEPFHGNLSPGSAGINP